jgi:hypothetical protein
MKNINLLTLLLLAVLFTFSSCSDKDGDPTPQTNKEILSAKTWKVSMIKGDGIDITNESEVAIIKNMRIKFNTDGTYNQTTTGFSGNGIWEFTNNETSIVFDPNTADQEVWGITELKSNSLKMRTTMVYEENGEVETMLLELELINA